MQSAAMTLLVPAGSATDPVDRSGSATVLSDLVLRGAGERDNRQLTDYLDSLGLAALQQRRRAPHAVRLRGAGAARSSKASPPTPTSCGGRTCPSAAFEAARDLALQALAGIDDEPRQKLMIKLREWHLPSPYGRNSMGEKEHLEKLTLDLVQGGLTPRYHAEGCDPLVRRQRRFRAAEGGGRAALRRLERTAAASRSSSMPPPGNYPPRGPAERADAHRHRLSDRCPRRDPDYYTVRLAVEVLSGGMSGRLFTEVREKRGLCYSVWAGYSSLKGQAASSATPARATSAPRPRSTASSPNCIACSEGVTARRTRPRQDRPEGQHHHAGRIAPAPAPAPSPTTSSSAAASARSKRSRTRSTRSRVDQVNAYLKKHTSPARSRS